MGGQRLGQEEHSLRHGDRIRLAGSTVTFIFRQDAPKTEKMTAGPPTIGGPETDYQDEGRRQPVPHAEEFPPSLPDKEARLLSFLESRKGAPVSREEMIRSVWPELPLDEAIASQQVDKAVALLRAQIEEDPRRPRILLTVGEFGFLML